MLPGRGLFDCPWSFMLELSVLSQSGICIYSQFQMKQCSDFSTDIKVLSTSLIQKGENIMLHHRESRGLRSEKLGARPESRYSLYAESVPV